MNTKNTNNSQKKDINIHEVLDSNLSEKTDRLFEMSVNGVFRGENVRLAVERVVQWAFEVIELQKLAGTDPGSMPSFNRCGHRCDSVGKSLLPGDHQNQHFLRAHAIFCAMVELHIVGFEARWVGAMCNNIAAMDLSEDHPEVASVLRHALEKACVVSRFKWENDCDASMGSAETLNHPVVEELLESKSYFKNFLNPKEPHLLKKSFWNNVSHRGRFNPKSHIQAQINIIGVSVEKDMNPGDPGDFDDFKNLDNPPVAPMVPVLPVAPVATDELLMAEGASLWLSKKVLHMMDVAPFESGCAVVVVPRLFAHEEFAAISMQLLNDLPLRIARAIESESDEADLSTTVCLHLGISGIEDTSVDTALVAQARMHYLVSIVYRQIDTENQSILDIALNDCDIFPNGVSANRLRKFHDALNEICGAVTPDDVVLVPKDIDSFFTGLRDGIRRQRGQVFLERISELLEQHQSAAEDIYFEIRKDPLSAGFLFVVSDGWLNYMGETPWPHLSFDTSDLQHQHLVTMSKVIGIRNKKDVFLVDFAGNS